MVGRQTAKSREKQKGKIAVTVEALQETDARTNTPEELTSSSELNLNRRKIKKKALTYFSLSYFVLFLSSFIELSVESERKHPARLPPAVCASFHSSSDAESDGGF